MIGDAHLASDDYIAPNKRASGNSSLCRHQRPLADLDVVCQVYEVIQFYLGRESRDAQRTTGNRGIGADFHIVGDLQSASLRKLPMFALVCHVAKPIATQNCSRMYDNVAAHPDARVERHARV